ncbi:hypothetical protein ABT354_32780 [Streptomyces sp. NPDC000594]|uniref:hypothetical protein n=1 Tax=Streptomyces sp. NPDC000594 TaxID=3154261 RepID=UPI00331B0A4F
MRSKRLLPLGGACALLMAAGTIAAPAAQAAEEPRRNPVGNHTGGSVTPPGENIALSDQGKDKTAVTESFAQAEDGRITWAEYNKREARYLKKYKRAKRISAHSSVAPKERTLKLTHYAQKNNFFCGPATGIMMVKMADGKIRSKYNRNKFNQTNMGNRSHMDTARAGLTDWTTKQFERGIDRWRGENWYVQVPSPSGKQAVKTMRHSIGNNGMPIAADTVEFRNGPHYNSHPRNLTIGHWITAYGYTSKGSKSKWADPSTSVWQGVKKKFTAGTKGFADTYLQSNGYVY